MSAGSGTGAGFIMGDARAAVQGIRRKRKRTRNACDDCRGRKIKCDGEQPCSSCAGYEQECTYRRQIKPKYAGPVYVQELETKLERLRAVLASVLPDVDLNDPNLETAVAEHIRLKESRIKVEHREVGAQTLVPDNNSGTISAEPDELLDTMIQATTQLNIDGRGRVDFYGDFSGLTFLHRIRERCSQMVDGDFVKREIFSQLSNPPAFGPPGSSMYVLNAEPMSTYLLPPRSTAQQLTKIALTEACCLIKFIHQPSFDRLLNRVYDLRGEDYSFEEERFLALLYMTLAIGDLYSEVLANGDMPAKKDPSKMKGARYFRAAQTLLDVLDCCDIISVQTLLCMIIYLQSSAMMSSCYSHICIATASALRMGLHRSVVSTKLDPIEQEMRRRTFWALRTMDVYVTTMLGLPRTLNDEDIDQELPHNVDDEFITKDGILPMPESHNSVMLAVNAHTKLLLIMSNVVRYIYPEQKACDRHNSYRVNYGKVFKVETELDLWFQNIPQPPSPNQVISQDELRVQLLLRLAYAHVQMVLYRPFIHHIVRPNRDNPLELRSYACASAYIKAAMQVVCVVDKMDGGGVLNSSYWFTVYITFFAVMSLCMFVLGNIEDPTVDESMSAAKRGHDILIKLALGSPNAQRCVTSLESIFEKTSAVWSKRAACFKSLSRSESYLAGLRRASSNNQADSAIYAPQLNQTIAESSISPIKFLIDTLPGYDPTLSRTISEGSYSASHTQHDLVAMVHPGGYQELIRHDSSMGLEEYGNYFMRGITDPSGASGGAF